MAFELFTKKSGRGGGEAKVTIAKEGSMRINTVCLAKHFEKVNYVQLLFDAKRRQIALKPASAKAEHAYKLCRMQQGGATLSGLAFLTHYKIKHTTTKAYSARWMESPGAVVILLK